jgi:hypothetical protein
VSQKVKPARTDSRAVCRAFMVSFGVIRAEHDSVKQDRTSYERVTSVRRTDIDEEAVEDGVVDVTSSALDLTTNVIPSFRQTRAARPTNTK